METINCLNKLRWNKNIINNSARNSAGSNNIW
jgi:hypothetical protein